MLCYLAARPGQAVSREELLVQIWGYAPEATSRAPDTTVRRLREKIEAVAAEPEHLLTVFGQGYSLVLAEPPAEAADRPGERWFVGRQQELDRIAALLRSGGPVTLVGPPGAGKTRLATRTIELDDGPTRFCDLTEASSPDDVIRAVASALEIPLGPGGGAGEQLVRALASRGPVLLVLDNCEQAIDGAAQLVTSLGGAAPQVRVLATSRRVLGVDDEAVVQIEPLELADAVALFELLARRIRADFTIEAADRAVIEELVERLERLPLAIALAAGRLGAMSPIHLLQRLDERFRLLRSRSRDVEPRHRTLHAAVDWSWELLDGDERSALMQCAAFRGGFDAEAALAVLQVSGDPLQLLERLCAQSLLQLRGERYGGFAFIREFAGRRLEAHPELRDAAWRRHAIHFAQRRRALAPEARPILLSPERHNLRLAIERALRLGLPEQAAQCGLGLLDVLGREGPMEGVLQHLDRILELGGLPPDDEVELLRRHVLIQLRSGPIDVEARLQQAMSVAAGRDDLRRRVLSLQGRVLTHRGRHEQAERILREALQLAEAVGQPDGLCAVLGNLGLSFRARGRLDEARQAYARLVDLAADGVHVEHEMTGVSALALLERRAGRFGSAREHYQRALQLAQDAEIPFAECSSRMGLGNLALELGRLDEAEAEYLRVRSLCRRMGWRQTEGKIEGNLALVARGRGDLAAAADASGRALEVFEELQLPREAALARGNLGSTLLALGRLQQAEVMLSRSARTLRALGDHASEAEVLGPLAEAALARGDLASATSHLEAAEAKLRQLEDPLGLALILARRGLLELAEGRAADATLHEARLLVPDAGGDSELGLALDRLAEAIDASRR